MVGVLAVFGCHDDKSTSVKKPVDTIVIRSVKPDSGLDPGVVTNFVVDVEYELASADSGEVGIGFNTDEVGRFVMISDAKVLIAEGAGERQFNVSTVTRDWGETGDFQVLVNLSEHPHGPAWTALAGDTWVLTF
jgi:hypothetical protein